MNFHGHFLMLSSSLHQTSMESRTSTSHAFHYQSNHVTLQASLPYDQACTSNKTTMLIYIKDNMSNYKPLSIGIPLENLDMSIKQVPAVLITNTKTGFHGSPTHLCKVTSVPQSTISIMSSSKQQIATHQNKTTHQIAHSK